MSSVFDPYDVLGVQLGTGRKELRAAYRAGVHRWHPDRNPDDPRAPRRLRRVVAAYQILTGRSADFWAADAATRERWTPPAAPVRFRFVCPKCDDSFEFDEPCVRCCVSPWDSCSSEPHPGFPADSAVEGLVARLESARPAGPPWVDPEAAPFYAAGLFFVGGFVISSLGPVVPGLMLSAWGGLLGLTALGARAKAAGHGGAATRHRTGPRWRRCSSHP